MRLKTIETIIDSIDVYNVVKDMGLPIIEKQIPNAKEKVTYTSTQLFNSELRVLNNAALNLDLYKGLFPDFIAGSGIDLLAAYYHNDYDKAFDAYFRIYGNALKSKLIHSPAFIKGVIKNTFIKRHNILNIILKYLFGDSFQKNLQAKTWLNKNNIEENYAKGYMFSLDTKELHTLFTFILNQEFINIDQILMDKLEDNYPLKTLLPDLDFSGYPTSWIIIPYFSNYYSISFFKIINPTTNSICYVYLDDIKIAYAGLYTLNKYVDFNNKIRLLEDSTETAALLSNAKKLLNSQYQYLSIGVNEQGENAPALAFNKPIFLYKPNSSFSLIKALNVSLPNLYICDFNNFTESNIVFKWEDFIFRELKKLVQEDAFLSPRIKAFFEIVDFSTISIKKHISLWLKTKGYSDIYSAFNTIETTVAHFKNYSISATPNGYIALNKTTNDTIVISNFIIKLDSCIVFKEKDDMKINGVVIMGENEYPVEFFRKELSKKDSIENIALKAFANFNILDGLFKTNDPNAINTKMPIVLDKSYNSALSTIINTELSKVPCQFGNNNLGWDKANNVFATYPWRATSTGLKVQQQNFYTTPSVDYIYNKTLIKLSKYKHNNLEFLNKDIKDCISIILSYLYRSYFSYDLKPFLVTDTKLSRNLLRFIFAALGQREVLEYDVNDRLIKNKKVFVNFNKMPILVRTNNLEHLLKVKGYPYVLFTPLDADVEEEPFDVSFALKADDYPKVTKFTLDTLERFFNWLFSNKVEQFELKSSSISNQDQLIQEGNIIFDYLWWDDIIEACKKDVDAQESAKKFFGNLTKDQILQYLKLFPEEDTYIFRKNTVYTFGEKTRGYAKAALKASGKLKEPLVFQSKLKPYHDNFFVFKRELIEHIFSVIDTADGQKINLDELTVHLSPNVFSENNSIERGVIEFANVSRKLN